MEHALLLRGLTKSFGTTRAVDRLDLVVPRGGLYGLIGPSGAGKTTCIRMIMSILFPDTGELSVLGLPSALQAKDRIGYLPEERGVYRKMKVAAFLVYMGQLKGMRAADAASRATRLLERVGLKDIENKRCEEMSKGMLQRVQFVAAIIHEPDLVILDEPFSGLDPVTVRLLRDQIAAEHRRGATILLSTHVMSHAEAICEHVLMIHEGRKVLDEPMIGLRRQFDPRVIMFEPLDPDADLLPLRHLPGVEQVEAADGAYRIQIAETASAATLMPQMASLVPAARIELARLHLEDVFVQIVTRGARTGDAARQLRAGLRAPGAEGALA